jgi:hypothetical protein
MKLLLAALCALLLGPCSFASELIDLGQGLGYLRVHHLDEAVKPLAGGNTIVLDLRQTTVAAGSVAPFAAALAARPAGARLFVLVSPATPAALADLLPRSLVTLGIKGSQPEPRVVVQQSADDDRQAYAALETGTALADLLSGKVEKDRYDEASLVQEFKGGNLDARPPENVLAKGPAAPARLTDRVLQRAVHLHRALLALKR